MPQVSTASNAETPGGVLSLGAVGVVSVCGSDNLVRGPNVGAAAAEPAIKVGHKNGHIRVLI
jgi:hypothetical protein